MPRYSKLPLLGSTPHLGHTRQHAPDADCLEPGDYPPGWFIKEPQGQESIWFRLTTCVRCHQRPGAQSTTLAAPPASLVPGKANVPGHRGWRLLFVFTICHVCVWPFPPSLHGGWQYVVSRQLQHKMSSVLIFQKRTIFLVISMAPTTAEA